MRQNLAMELQVPTIADTHEEIITKADFRKWCKASPWKDQLPGLMEASAYFFEYGSHWDAFLSKTGKMIWGVFSYHIELHYEDNRGHFGWLSPRGHFLPCTWGGHLVLCELIFGIDEEELESSWVKVTRNSAYEFLTMGPERLTSAQEKMLNTLEIKYLDIQ